MASDAAERYDVLIIGGGPAGATAARCLALDGVRTAVFEREAHPRFHIGESFLPRNLDLIRELGLEERLRALPHTVKHGGSFAFGDADELTDFWFRDAFELGGSVAFNIERAPFDAMLLQAAKDAGAEVRERASVRQVLRLDDGDVEVEVEQDGERRRYAGRILLDASGQGTVVGRHLKTRRTLPDLKRIAYYGHFHGLRWRRGEQEGMPVIIMIREGWFWLIPLTSEKISVGLVLDAQLARGIGVPPEEMLAWGIRRCPMVSRMTEPARFPERTFTTADYSYTCRPYAGPGYFLVGDAATFVDPIFSTGVCMGMMSAAEAARASRALLDGAAAEPLRRRYQALVEDSSGAFFHFVRRYYTHAFREVFLEREGPLEIHRAIIGILAGHVFPKPAFALRWRLGLFELIVRLHERVPFGPTRNNFSLIDAAPAS